MNKKTRVEDMSVDMIRSWIANPDTVELSPIQKTILERIDFAYDNLKIEPSHKVVKKIVYKFKVSFETALLDVERCKKIFNPTLRVDAEWLEQFIVNDALKQIKACQKMLDHKHWQAARADLLKIYAHIKQAGDKIDPSILGDNNYFMVVNFGSNAQKIDYNKLNSLPIQERVELTDFLFQDADEVQIEEILES